MLYQATEGQRVAAVVAHPDDAELMCFGTLRSLREAGAAVTVVIVTHGVGGVSVEDRAQGVRLAVEERLRESRAAYAGTGIEVECLGFVDGALKPDLALVSAIEAQLKRLGATVLITHAPRAGNDHQDHEAVGTAAVNAASRVSTCTTILHGEPHAPRSGFRPTMLVDITDLIEDKLLALKRHETQAGRWYLSDAYTRHRAAASGWRLAPALAAEGRLFEAFECSLQVLTPAAAPSSREN